MATLLPETKMQTCPRESSCTEERGGRELKARPFCPTHHGGTAPPGLGGREGHSRGGRNHWERLPQPSPLSRTDPGRSGLQGPAQTQQQAQPHARPGGPPRKPPPPAATAGPHCRRRRAQPTREARHPPGSGAGVYTGEGSRRLWDCAKERRGCPARLCTECRGKKGCSPPPAANRV